LGEFQIDGIPPAPRGIPKIEVTYEISADGILIVTSKLSDSNIEKKLEIKNDSNRLSQEEIQRMIDEAEKYKEQDKILRETIEAKNQFENAIYTAKAQNSNNNEQISKVVDDALGWLESHQNDSKEEYEKQLQLFTMKLAANQSSSENTNEEEKKNDEETGPAIEEVD
jgi:L1 cell adhesion molecule like protein